MNKYTLFILFLFCAIYVHAQNVTVANLADAGAGSLRQAINDIGAGGTITFAAGLSGGTINITTDHYIISKNNFTINGGGVIKINGSGLPAGKHIFYVNNNQQNITFQGLEITGATAPVGVTCGQDVVNGGMGIYLRPGANNITIRDCYIHTNASHGIYLEQNNTNVTIRDNTISGNCNNGILVQQGGNNSQLRIYGNKVGTNQAGTTAMGNKWDGIAIERTDAVIIGGATVAMRNVISGNGDGLVKAGDDEDRGIRLNNVRNSYIIGNHIGTNLAGTAAVGNGRHGVFLHSIWVGDPTLGSQNNVIGGITSDSMNVISGNGTIATVEGHGINLADERTTNNKIRGNYIGLARDGVTPLPNKNDGVSIFFSSNNTVGGPTSAYRNVISRNNFGVFIQMNANNNIVRNNYIGTDYTGTLARPNNESGVIIQGGYYSWYNWPAALADRFDGPSTGNQILDNLISGNTINGVVIQNGKFPDGVSRKPTQNNVVRRNIVGLNATQTVALANGGSGIVLGDRASNNEVGGTIVTDRNIVSGNLLNGIVLRDSCFNNRIFSNYIGVNVTEVARPNGIDGILIDSSNSNFIGSTTVNTGNLISANTKNGIRISKGSFNTILRNTIGTNLAGTASGLGNGDNGIMITTKPGVGGSVENVIGDAGDVTRKNVIAYNLANGILILDAASRLNPIRKNSIYCNAARGIELNSLGNDNYSTPVGRPIVNAAKTQMSGVVTANSIVEIFTHDPTCLDCQGKTFIAQVNANASGNWSYSTAITDETIYVITATQSGAGNRNTSEFSLCSTLPVNFISVNAVLVGESVTIDWKTASEKNNERFEVEYSKDGNTFSTIGNVKGAGNSNSVLSYYFIHENPSSVAGYYRIKQIDFDGKYAYSKTVSVGGVSSEIYLFPNPASNYISIRGYGYTDEINVTIANMLGTSVLSKALVKGKEEFEIMIDVSGLPGGVYYVQLSGESKQDIIPFIKN